MAIKYRTSLLDAQKYFIVTVHQYCGNHISGVIYHSLREDGIVFKNLIDLVEGIEEISAIIDYPSRCVERRSFKKSAKSSGPQEVMEEIEHQLQYTKALATFRIQIKHQYRGSWQGSVEETGEGQQMEFDSFLELMKIMEEHIRIAGKGTLAPELEIGKHIIYIEEELFILHLLFQKYGSWQGILYWSGRKEEIKFRSYLELMMIVSEALKLSREKKKIISFHKAVNQL